MDCIKPYKTDDDIPVRCNQCTPCRLMSQKVWTGRLLMEMKASQNSYFVTYTLEDENLIWQAPAGGLCEPVVDRDQIRSYIRNLRRKIDFRIFYIGEYGTHTQRPHYHAAIFTDSFDYELIQNTWKLGFTTIAPFDAARAAYICGYCLKGWTKYDHEDLGGRTPEFSQPSLKPAIGLSYLPKLIEWHETKDGAKYIAENGDILNVFRYQGKIYPLGRFLSNKLRTHFDIPNKAADRLQENPNAWMPENPEYPDGPELHRRREQLNVWKKKTQNKLVASATIHV